jgi:hypothetical protein
VGALAAPGAAALNGTTAASPPVYWDDAQKAGGVKANGAYSVAVANDGTVFVAGYFTGTAYFPSSADDSIALTATGGGNDYDGFVAALNKDDSYFAWAQKVGGIGGDEANSVAVAEDGTVLTTGYFQGTAYFPISADDSIALTATGGVDDYDVFVAALNTDDSYFAWAQKAGGTDEYDAYSVAVAQDGTVLVTGYVGGTAYFPTSTDESIALTSAGGKDIFVAALNKDDSYFAWAQRAGGATADEGYTVAVAKDDTVVVTGYFTGTAYFPTGAGADDSIALVSPAQSDIFVAALNTDDSYFAWAQKAGGLGDNVGNSVAVAPDGTVLVTGYFKGTSYFPTVDDSIALNATAGSADYDVFVAALSADDSYFAWAQKAGGNTSGDYGYSVAVAGDGTVLISGNFQGSAYFPTGADSDDSIALTAAGSNTDVFVAALNKDDSYFAWAQKAGGAADDEGYAVTVASDGTIVVAGAFGDTAYFPSGADDSLALTSLGSSNLFVGWLNRPATPTPPTPVTFPPGAPTAVTGLPEDAQVMVSWTPPSSSGSFPISTYQVAATPSGKGCLVQAPALSCMVTGLTNDTDYTFTTRALNGAGWGPFSAASDPVTPQAPVVVSLLITGTRGDVRGKPGVIVTGTSTGLDMGAILQPRVKLAGQPTYQQGTASILVDATGGFTWQRRTGKKVYVYIATEDKSQRSNRIIIRP